MMSYKTKEQLLKQCKGNMGVYMNTKHEALYMTLSGYAKNIIEVKDDYNIGIYNMSLKIDKYFKKPHPRYNNVVLKQITKYIKDKIEPQLQGKIAPSIMLCITLDYLLNEVRHLETRLRFAHYKSDIKKYLESVETSKYRKVCFEHQRLIGDM